MADSDLTDILWVEIKAIIKTEVKDAYDETLKDMDEVILLGGNGKRAPGTPNSEMDGKK